MSRRSIHIEGFDHGRQPIPAACRVGNIVMTGGVYELDSATGRLPDDVAAQTRLMFAHLKAILAAAGTNLDEVVKMTIWVKVPQARQAVTISGCGHFRTQSCGRRGTPCKTIIYRPICWFNATHGGGWRMSPGRSHAD